MKDGISIISIFNSDKLASQLKQSAENTKADLYVGYHLMDNRGNKLFRSAAEGYNFALDQFRDGDVLVFCHQDIIFLPDALKTIYRLCRENPNTLFGAAGVKNIRQKDDSRIISSMAVIQEGWNYKTLKRGEVQDVFTLDECLIAGNRDLFEHLRFDEDVCDGWHLYAAELCMQCHVKGYPVKVFYSNIVHLSGGNPDKSFYSCERKLVKKYRKHFSRITYSCGWTYTDPVRYGLLSLYRRVRYHI